LSKIDAILTDSLPGAIPADKFVSARISEIDMRLTRRTIWKFKLDLRALVKPGAEYRELATALAGAAPRNQRVVAVADALHVLKLHLKGRLAPSAVELTKDEQDRKYLSLRWRKDIHPAWLRASTLYLDAADIGSFEIAEAWLPDLELKVQARATAPHMRIMQLVDSQLAYRKLVAGMADDALTDTRNGETAQNNRRR
jgi:hypothetical protein